MQVEFLSEATPEALDNQADELIRTWAALPACSDFDPADLIELCRDGRAVIGVVRDGGQVVLAGAFEFVRYPRQVAVNIMALAGSRMTQAMGEFWSTFRAWCASAGADVIEARCAPGMTRLLQANGFEFGYAVMRQKLEA